MPSQFITYEIEDSIALIGLNRTDKRNAMHGALFDELAEAVARAEDEAKVGIIHGHGDHFSAGLDLDYAVNHMLKMDPVRRRRKKDPSRAAIDNIARGELPWIAALHGGVIGAGFELSAAAHIRVADETAFFALPEGQRGIFVGGGGSVRIQRLIGYARMADMMLTGRSYTAEQAERIEAVQYVVPAGEALTKAKELAQKIAGNAPLSNYAVTASLPRIADMSAEEGLFFEALTADYIATDESTERMKDFLEKRAAKVAAPKGTKGS